MLLFIIISQSLVVFVFVLFEYINYFKKSEKHQEKSLIKKGNKNFSRKYIIKYKIMTDVADQKYNPVFHLVYKNTWRWSAWDAKIPHDQKYSVIFINISYSVTYNNLRIKISNFFSLKKETMLQVNLISRLLKWYILEIWLLQEVCSIVHIAWCKASATINESNHFAHLTIL